jgi:hypothetical protein
MEEGAGASPAGGLGVSPDSILLSPKIGGSKGVESRKTDHLNDRTGVPNATLADLWILVSLKRSLDKHFQHIYIVGGFTT